MTWAAELEGIVQRFNAQTSVPNLAWDAFGDRFDPTQIDVSDTDAARWARLTVAPVPRAVAPIRGVSRPGPVSLGANAKNYREGLIVVQHFYPHGFGIDQLMDDVDETRGIFHRATFGNVVCRDADEPELVGRDSSGEWFQVNQTIPFYVMETV